MNVQNFCGISFRPSGRWEKSSASATTIHTVPNRPRTPTEKERIIYSMRALGERDLPESFDIGGTTYRREREIKHDFFAATGFYQTEREPRERVVLKMSRSADFCGLPLIWLGRWLCRREMRFYRKLADVPNI